MNPLSYASPNDLNISGISGSSKTFSSLRYDKNSNMFTTEVEKETELLLEKNIYFQVDLKRKMENVYFRKNGQEFFHKSWLL